MAWFNAKNGSGNFPDLADPVNKLLESEKNLETNFDTTLSFDDKGKFGNEGSIYLRLVNKLLESEKNIEKNSGNAFGFEEKGESSFYLRSVNKLLESEKNIEKDFDNALGIKEKRESGNEDSILELVEVKREMKMKALALQGAARQAQAEADGITKVTLDYIFRLRALIKELKRKSNEAEVESLRQRISSLARKVYFMLSLEKWFRERGKRSDPAALLRWKNETKPESYPKSV